jgi:hypothetical protein
MKRAGWFYIAALCAGSALGLLYSWVLSPVRYVDTSPDTLRADFKDRFRTAIASAYAATGNLARAGTRLGLLGDADAVSALSAQAQRTLAAGGSFEEAQQLAGLARDIQLGVASISPATEVAVIIPTLEASPITLTSTSLPGSDSDPLVPLTPTTTVIPTIVPPTPRPTQTVMPTPSAPFLLISRDQVCDPNLMEGLMQVMVLDRTGQPMPAIELTITSDLGEERFFTGFKPEVSSGFADYVMESNRMYSLLVARVGPPVTDLVAPTCTGPGSRSYLGGLKLLFRQP